MFWHNFKYDILHTIKAKDLVLWLMIFPIVLGSFFKISFDGIYEKSTKFSSVKTAVVEIKENKIFKQVLDEISSGDDPLLTPVYTDSDQAMELLESHEVSGIIWVDEELSLSVSSQGTAQTIIKSFLEQYKTQQEIITDTALNNPSALGDVICAFNGQENVIENIDLTDGNTNFYMTYFYNLIAMVAFFGSMTGLHISIENQAHLSSLGARKSCSPTPKSISLTANILSCFVVQSACVAVCVSFLSFILKIDFGSRLPLVYLTGILGGFLGVAMGFMVGSIGSLSKSAKEGISMTVTLLCCFFSGLMVGDMKSLFAKYAPWVNKINPAALISDSLYCLNIYSDYSRYIEKIISILVITVIFILIGFLLTRRKKYASI